MCNIDVHFRDWFEYPHCEHLSYLFFTCQSLLGSHATSISRLSQTFWRFNALHFLLSLSLTRPIHTSQLIFSAVIFSIQWFSFVFQFTIYIWMENAWKDKKTFFSYSFILLFPKEMSFFKYFIAVFLYRFLSSHRRRRRNMECFSNHYSWRCRYWKTSFFWYSL